MKYYLNLFSPETYEAFSHSDMTISGFRSRHINAAEKVKPGDRLICYITKLSRWCGLLEVESAYFIDDKPIFYKESDPFTVRFKVRHIVWLPKEKTIPIHDETLWAKLSFTKHHDKRSSTWTGKLRGSLVQLNTDDSKILEQAIFAQEENAKLFPVNEAEYAKLIKQTVRRLDGPVNVTVPMEDLDKPVDEQSQTIRESHKIQALLASIGNKMGYKIWIPKADRTAVLSSWVAEDNALIDSLPLNYDDTTLRTIEQIDVLWLKGRAIVRAFEVEQTTSVYSGILRMADLLALQPNMDIRLHIVAPASRRDKVFQEIQRPVFSLLERGPLSTLCTYISYDSVEELSNIPHLNHMSDSILGEYEEEAE